MKFLHTMLRVTDFDAALNSWRDILGLVEANRIENTNERFTLVFLSAEEDEGRSFEHLAFVVGDIIETCCLAAGAGVIINRPPRDGHMAFVRSPDGQSVELLQIGAPKTPTEPWQSMPNSGNW